MKLKLLIMGIFLLLFSRIGFSSSIGFDTTSLDGKTLNLGETITLEIIGDFDVPTIGGGLNIIFKSSVLRVDNVIFDNTVFDFRTQVNKIDNTVGLVESILVSSIQGEHDGRFTIAEVKFTVIGSGISQLDLKPSTFNAPWTSGSREEIAIDFIESSVQVTAVPLPAVFFLLFSRLRNLANINNDGFNLLNFS